MLMFPSWYFHRRCVCRQRWSWGCLSRMSTFTTVWETLLWRTNQWPWCMNPSLWRTESRISSTGGSNHRTAVIQPPDYLLLVFSVLVCARVYSFTLLFVATLFIKKMPHWLVHFVQYAKASGTAEVYIGGDTQQYLWFSGCIKAQVYFRTRTCTFVSSK